MHISSFRTPSNEGLVSGTPRTFTATVCDLYVSSQILVGSRLTAETLIGDWIAKNPSLRKDIFLCTKFGFRRLPVDMMAGPCSDPAYVPQALEASLQKLQTDYIDLYYQHRIDPNVPIELVLEALRPAVEAGKVRWIGLSECSEESLRRAKAVPMLGDKVIAVQMEYSPFTLDVEKNGFAKACEELGVAIVAYSPLSRGLVSGR
jgi:aryl-alcohol dehydrogenase-like predicted oxidoreductase